MFIFEIGTLYKRLSTPYTSARSHERRIVAPRIMFLLRDLSTGMLLAVSRYDMMKSSVADL